MIENNKILLMALLLSSSILSGCIRHEEGNTPPMASLSISPSSYGYAPFNVTFYMNAQDSDGYIVSWSLDINNDGIADFTGNGSELPKMINYTYTVAGNYTAKLIVIDNNGSTDESIVVIAVLNKTQNAPPTCFISANVAQGYAPLKVSFTANVQDDGYIVKYTWNFDDGITSHEKNPVHVFSNAGTYNVTLVVEDNGGLTASSYILITVWEKEIENNPPSCSISASPLSGNSPLTVTFSLDAYDSDGYIASWELDVNNNGIPEYIGLNNPPSTKQYTYKDAGTYTANLTVIDDDGAKASAIITITVIKHESTEGNITIASWNLQIFGVTKASNETLLNYYADKIDDYDICVIQEIRDKSGTAIQKLAAKLPEYHYIISQRAGTTSSKEQYAIFYDDKVTLISYHDYTPELQDEFERPPLEAEFKANNWTFTLYTIHTKPDNVYQELTNLENLIGEPDGDTIILGDLNADGSYYDEDNIQHFTTWHWVITNDMDTTVAASNNTYDRIIINQYAENNFIEAGVMNDVTPDESDHYLVYGVFRTNVY